MGEDFRAQRFRRGRCPNPHGIGKYTRFEASYSSASANVVQVLAIACCIVQLVGQYRESHSHDNANDSNGKSQLQFAVSLGNIKQTDQMASPF